MQRGPYENWLEYADAVACGIYTHHEKGRQVFRRLTQKEMAEYRAAKERHYVIVGPRNLLVGNAYALWCRGANVPFVRLWRERPFAAVSLDLTDLQPRDDLHPDARRAITALFIAEIACQGAPRKRFGVGRYSYCSRVPAERAEAVAAALWAIATTPHVWHVCRAGDEGIG
jgi:hypothetical protein